MCNGKRLVPVLECYCALGCIVSSQNAWAVAAPFTLWLMGKPDDNRVICDDNGYFSISLYNSRAVACKRCVCKIQAPWKIQQDQQSHSDILHESNIHRFYAYVEEPVKRNFSSFETNVQIQGCEQTPLYGAIQFWSLASCFPAGWLESLHSYYSVFSIIRVYFPSLSFQRSE